jgi:hypothetical protein
VHLVELHPQVGDAGAGLLAGFQIEQETVAVVLDGAQLVELRVQPGCDDAAVANQGRGLIEDGAGQ